MPEKKRGRSDRQSPKKVRESAESGPPRAEPSLIVAGIGASAGGLEAFTQLLQHLPDNSGVAFVLVQHLDPKHESILPSLLARATPMPVREARDGARLQANQVHVIPPDMDIGIADGHLQLVPRPTTRGAHMPLDFFLRMLAQAQGSRAIAVILSGTGSDGTLGCKAVKEAGGIAFAQDPASAKYDGMPNSAIAGGCVDFVLPPKEIAREIARLAREPYLRAQLGGEIATAATDDAGPLQRIFMVLKKLTGADFTCYRKTTLMRRILRRMAVQKIESLADYSKHLESDRSEVQALHQDLLINVTSFFRDPQTFETLCRQVFPRILGGRSADTPVRVWVPGCATGEEAYSLAICLLESLSSLPSNPPLQVFATDLSETAIERARAGIYPENIAADVSPERLLRFFVRVDGRYQVSKPVRDLIVFARQDLARDPPFSKLDLVSCRNVLIYLEPSLQKKVLATFHYALHPSGFLVLGRSETAAAGADLFEVVDKEHKVYAKLAAANPRALSIPAAVPAGEAGEKRRKTAPAFSGAERRSDVEKEAERLLLHRFAPASVIIDEKEQVVHFRGDTETYLGHVQGAASFHLMTMARKGLVSELRLLLQKARANNGPQRKEGLHFRHRGRQLRVNLEVAPIKGPDSGERSYLVLFEEGGEKRAVAPPVSVPREEQPKQRRIAELEQEILALRHYQNSMEGEQAASQEELQSANEEVLSSNEELQSINEELETAKEELQSSNEELVTLNEELQNRNRELSRANDDLDNFLASTTLPKLMMDRDLVLRRFTPAAAKLLKLVPADVGRPLGNLRMEGIDVRGLELLTLEVIETNSPVERELQDHEGRWWRLHVRPYRTRENRIDGAVIVLVDINALKRNQQVLEEARDFADAIVDTATGPLLVLDRDLIVKRANQSFYKSFRVSPEETEGVSVYELGDRQWGIPELRTLLEEVLPRESSFKDYEVEQDFPAIGRRTLRLNGRKLRQEAGREEMILLAIEDLTEAARAQADRAELLRRTQEATRAAEAASRVKDEFVAVASHELRGPLNAMVGWVHLLSGGRLDQTTSARALEVIDRSVKAQTRLIDELLDVTRLATGKLRLSVRVVELLPIVEAAMESARSAAEAKGIDLSLGTDVTSELVRGDGDRLRQVVWNLLSNAVKFTPTGGEVEVWTGRVGSFLHVKVTDTGEGIAAEFLPHIFERFRQADSSSARKQPGLGLGLAIVRELVELHGGTVSAESPGKGQGSTFVVSLPIPALTVEPASVGEATETPAANAWTIPDPSVLSGLRVLIVDDDPDGRYLLETVLEQCGAKVTATSSAAEALAALDREVPQILVSDIGLPDQDGYELMSELRKRPPERGGAVPALALTAFAAAEDRQRTAAVGYQAYLAKPADPAELVKMVAALSRAREQA